MVNVLICPLLLSCLFMACLWFYQFKTKEADIVDFGWTICLGFFGIYYANNFEGDSLTRYFVASFSAIWAFRLASHLWRRVKTAGEDGRYVALRQAWGKQAQIKFFIFFQVQAILAFVLSLSFIIPILNQTTLMPWQAAFALFWFTFSICGEWIADKQLEQWRNNPNNHGKTCRKGLWNYSRHPNYFFEWLYWFSYFFLALGADYWYLTLVSPAILLYSILKVTGIPPTEQRALLSRGQDYVDYQKTTSAFFPWFRAKT